LPFVQLRRVLAAVRQIVSAVVVAIWQGAFVAGFALLLAYNVAGVTTSHTQAAAAAVASVIVVGLMRERQRRVLRRRRQAARRRQRDRRLRDLAAQELAHEQREIAVQRARRTVRETLARHA